jgi:predicted sugar kinase
VGLSSLGPLIYGIFDREDTESQMSFEQIARSTGANYLGAFTGNNEGFLVESI